MTDDLRKSVPAAGLFMAAIGLVAFFAGRLLAQAWTLAPDLGHGWALPWLMGWLLWERATTGKIRSGRTPGVLLWIALGCGLAVYAVLRLLLEPFPLWPSLLWLLTALLYGFLIAATWLAGGAAWVRRMAGPLALLFTAVPWPGVVENAFLNPLRQALAAGVAEVLNLLSVPAFSEGATIQIAGGLVGVDEACGGMRSLQTALMIGWFVGEVARMRIGRRLALLAGAAAAAVAGNFLRALVLTWLMDAGGHALLEKWHDPAGYLALGSTLVVVLLLGWWWRPQAGAEPTLSSQDWRMPAVAAAWALTGLVVCGLVEVGVGRWYTSGEHRAGQVPTWDVSWPKDAKNFRMVPLSDRAREILKPDGFSSAGWRAADDADRSGYYILWETGQQARNLPFLHGPEVCLPMSGIELVGRDEPVVVEVNGLRLPFDAYEFRQYGRPLYVFRIVWNSADGLKVTPRHDSTGEFKWLEDRWSDVAERRVAVRAQVLTLAIGGARDRDAAVQAFHEEINRIVHPGTR
jgi:exosortase